MYIIHDVNEAWYRDVSLHCEHLRKSVPISPSLKSKQAGLVGQVKLLPSSIWLYARDTYSSVQHSIYPNTFTNIYIYVTLDDNLLEKEKLNQINNLYNLRQELLIVWKPRKSVTSSCWTARNVKGKDFWLLERDAMFWLIFADVSEESVSIFSTVFYDKGAAS